MIWIIPKNISGPKIPRTTALHSWGDSVIRTTNDVNAITTEVGLVIRDLEIVPATNALGIYTTAGAYWNVSRSLEADGVSVSREMF
jgi:hypothetical protein